MSLSDSGEDEQITILEAQRATHAPARKRRRLNNDRSQDQGSESSDDEDNDSSSADDPKSNSDKENSLNQQNRKYSKKRPRPVTQPSPRNSNNRNRRSSTQSNAVYRFGKTTFDFPITANPGALIRLELVNFLCHENFSISFNPMVNIICGRNGSGKSAIEAGISMALGVNARKSGRGRNTNDVIKFDQDRALIRLFLHNAGPEALPEYGSEICIERRLTRNSKNGTSVVKILDGITLKQKAKGAGAVKDIANKLNLNADNPCVILKQSTAKEFLNSTKKSDKFKFFMSASKLGDYEIAMNEARSQLRDAQQEQKQSKGSFSVIRDRYKECKKRFDMLMNMQDQERTVVFWKRAGEWMIYHAQCKGTQKHEDLVEQLQHKIQSGNNTLKQKQQEFTDNLARGKRLKMEMEQKTAETDRFIQPMNVAKKEMQVLDKKRQDITRQASSTQRMVDTVQRRIREHERQYNQCLQQLRNNAKAQKLAKLNENLGNGTERMNALRTERETLVNKAEPSIEMKNNQQRLNQLQSEKTWKEEKIQEIQREVRTLTGNRNRSDLFLDFNARKKRISMQAIRQEIQRHHRKFDRLPIGPLGEYINITDTGDHGQTAKHIQIVQNVLNQSLFMFLVSTTKDLETFRRIIRDQFGITIGCIQYPHSNEMHNICANPFDNYRLRDGDNANILRVTDMFTIKDNNPWIYNAILTNGSPERVYAHGTMDECRRLLSNLGAQQQRGVSYLLTYNESKGLYKVSRRGHSVAGTPQRQQKPILQSDQTQMKLWYQGQIEQHQHERQVMENELQTLYQFVDANKQNIRQNKQRLNRVERDLKSLENKIERWQREKTQIEEDEEDDNELQTAMTELQETIDDEKANIAQLMSEIAPFREEESVLLMQVADKKKQLLGIGQELKNAQHSVQLQSQQYQEVLAQLQREKATIQRIPVKIQEYKEDLDGAQKELEAEKQRINELLNSAQKLGDEVRKEEYPRNDRTKRTFTLHQLRQNTRKLEIGIETWKQSENNDPDDIVQRFESIKPKYEHHQSKVENCNRNCDEMMRQLNARKKSYDCMKEQVRTQLSTEFRFIMRKQGHDGRLAVDYESKELDMHVHMSSHDGSTQVINTKTLSGGERSFTQVALIMALQKFSGAPMCIYDEFDVFMDSVNRGNSIRILLHAALGDTSDNETNQPKGTERQYIFITPNDVSPIIREGHKNEISIHKLDPPRK